MAIPGFRVRRNTAEGPTVVGHFWSMKVAQRYARKRFRETGNVMRIERRTEHGWETATELAPQVTSPVEAQVARAKLPKVQEKGTGRKGQMLSYMAAQRQARVAWLDQEHPGRGELVSIDNLELR